MDKFIPYQKLSKKEKRRLNALGRTTWGPVSPVTRKPENSRAYNRRKARSLKGQIPGNFYVNLRAQKETAPNRHQISGQGLSL